MEHTHITWGKILWEKQNGNVGSRRKWNDTAVLRIKQEWLTSFLNEWWRFSTFLVFTLHRVYLEEFCNHLFFKCQCLQHTGKPIFCDCCNLWWKFWMSTEKCVRGNLVLLGLNYSISLQENISKSTAAGDPGFLIEDRTVFLPPFPELWLITSLSLGATRDQCPLACCVFLSLSNLWAPFKGKYRVDPYCWLTLFL